MYIGTYFPIIYNESFPKILYLKESASAKESCNYWKQHFSLGNMVFLIPWKITFPIIYNMFSPFLIPFCLNPMDYNNVHCVKSVHIRSYASYLSVLSPNIRKENTDQNNSEYGHFLSSGPVSRIMYIFEIWHGFLKWNEYWYETFCTNNLNAKNSKPLTHFNPMFYFYPPWTRQKTFVFLTFSGV